MKSFFKPIIISCILFATLKLVANNDSVYQVVNRELFFDKIYNNPATAFLSPISKEYGIFEAGYTYTNKKTLHLLNEGKSLGAFSLNAEGLTRRNNTIFWGKFQYQRSKTSNVQWSNVSDSYRIGPYVIADSIGGDSYGERYNLSGGLAYSYHKWVFAGEAGYRIGNDYRKKDPRPKSTVSDIYLKLSSTFNINKYSVGVTAEAGKYQQRLDTKVQREGSYYDFFSLKGFGYHHIQLSSYSRSFDWTYKGTNYGGSIFFLPFQNGFLGSSKLMYEGIESQYEASYKPYILRTYSSINQLGWQHKGNRKNTFIKANYEYILGKGTERVYHIQKINEAATEYFLLYSSQFYTRKTINYSLSARQEWFSQNSSKWIEAKLGASEYTERYSYPTNKLVYKHLISSVTAGGEFNTSKTSTLMPQINISYYPLLSKIENVENGGELIEQSLYPDMKVRASDFIGLEAKLTYQYKLKSNLCLYVSTNGNYWFDGDRNRWTTSCTIGVRY